MVDPLGVNPVVSMRDGVVAGLHVLGQGYEF